MEVKTYAAELDRLLADPEKKYGYGELDAFLVLKDILAVVWKNRKEPANKTDLFGMSATKRRADLSSSALLFLRKRV
ncbi:MAG: hypothetical protein HFH60_03310 [Lachnospiraceae bacterium]|nr:hypothetical protein [Lachnospiraceae bacterium]MCI9545707.1 hypothetical protein [Lachnospiraceae bacterium]